MKIKCGGEERGGGCFDTNSNSIMPSSVFSPWGLCVLYTSDGNTAQLTQSGEWQSERERGNGEKQGRGGMTGWRGSNSELFIRSSSKKQFRDRASDARLSTNWLETYDAYKVGLVSVKGGGKSRFQPNTPVWIWHGLPSPSSCHEPPSNQRPLLGDDRKRRRADLVLELDTCLQNKGSGVLNWTLSFRSLLLILCFITDLTYNDTTAVPK